MRRQNKYVLPRAYRFPRPPSISYERDADPLHRSNPNVFLYERPSTATPRLIICLAV